VQTQLRDLHREQHQDVAELLQELKQLLVSGRDSGTDTPIYQIERDLHIPTELDTKFTSEFQKRMEPVDQDIDSPNPELALSVKDGLDVFFSHFNEVRPNRRINYRSPTYC
jgi:hypothetical protein